MLVSAKQSLVTLLPKRPGDEPSADAAAGLQGGMQAVIAQALQNNVQAQTTQATTQVQESATQSATQQVSEAAKVSDNVEEAFAKTRVNLQAVYAPLPEGVKESIGTKGSATDQFKDYMSKTPEERLRDAILDEMGLTQEEIDQMPPEKQMAIGEEIAQRIQDKAEIAKAEKEHENGDQNKLQVVDKFLAAL
jgi:hypothetical protein